jgi:catechol 2,3-dioxygenase-like lactoylglutathione lyase family enzyme
MADSRPAKSPSLRHLALNVQQLEACERFYVDLLGMRVEWRPDADNVYLTGGRDNLALHRAAAPRSAGQSLDHIGFVLGTMEAVDQWYNFLRGQGVKITAVPKTHRDGARSFYVLDPDGNTIQLLYHPPLAGVL